MKRIYTFQKVKSGILSFTFLTLFCLIGFNFQLSAQTTISGKITDVSTGEGLIGANVLITGTGTGTVTDIDGNFTLQSSQALPWRVEISYTGYLTQYLDVTNSNAKLDVKMDVDAIGIDQVVVSASRKREKVQEAPASISVISGAKLAVSPQAADVTRNLVTVPGVQLQQQSASRLNIEMRGQSLIFNTGIFPIMDYRSLIGPGLGTFNASGAGLSTVDMERIEVVRGPGSALYGPGVVSGVVHFITKSPIEHPGTTIEVFGGELETFGATVRHAGTNESKKFGYKINAQYKRGNEFTLDSEEDAAQIAKFKTSVSQPFLTETGVVDVTKPGEVLLTEEDLNPDGDDNMMADDWWNAAANATLEFRPQDNLNVTVSGGYNQFKEVFYNSQGEGLNQNAEYWTQARVQFGGLFGQVFFVDNDGGTKERPTFLYQTGLRTPVARKQLEGQLQYNFDVPVLLNGDFTAGLDYRKATSDTEGLVYGRNENDDDYEIYGGYLQGKFEITDKIDFLAAARYDQFNFLDEGFLSPRAAIVYKVSPKHTVRATYNRAATPPTALNVNIDFPVAVPVPGLFDIWLTGTKDQHTYENPVIDVTIPGVPDLPVQTPGLPLAIPYSLATQGVLDQLVPALTGTPLEGLIPAITGYLTNPANAPQGFTGTLQQYNIFTGQPYGDLTPSSESVLSETNSYEIGYKGLFGDRFSVSADFYTNDTKGLTVFGATGPTIRLTGANLSEDLGSAVQTGIEPFLISLGLDEPTAAAVAAQIGGGYAAAGTVIDGQLSPLYPIFGAIESDLVPQGDGIVHSPAGYPNFSDASYDYWGADIGLQYYFTNDIAGFFNYSYLSQNVWTPGEDDDDGLPFLFTLNSPKSKFRLGALYAPENGWRGSFSFQHDDSFFASFGQFSGDADEKNLFDASIGYAFTNGLSFDLTAQNVFDNEYRAFPNFPKIGRRVLVKAVYTFGNN